MTLEFCIERVLTETLGLDPAAMGKGFADRIVKTLKREFENADKEVRTLSPEEETRLISAAVVPETWFFRDEGPFHYLRTTLREMERARDGKEKMTVLSAPCSSGEEPYSIAMSFIEAGYAPGTFTIDALDICEAALRTAELGVYGKGSFRTMDAGRQGRFFSREGEKFRLRKSVISSVRFFSANLLRMEREGPLPEYDLIFCRNLLIYLHQKAREKVFSLIHRLLRPGGLLVAGHTEVLFWQSRGYLPVPFPRSFTLIKPDDTQRGRTILFERAAEIGANGGGLPGTAGARHGAGFVRMEPRPGGFCEGERQTVNAEARDKEAANTPTAAVDGSDGEDNAVRGRLLGRARSLADGGDFNAALAACRAYLQKESPCAEVYSLMGLIHDAGNRLGEAEDCYRRALYLDPHHVEALIHAALLYERRNETGKAALFRRRAETARENQHNMSAGTT